MSGNSIISEVIDRLGTREKFNIMAGKKVASIFDKNDNDDDHEHGHGQAFYAGGSEHSGQQILGPDREMNIVENLLQDARRHAQLDPAPSEQTLPVTLWRNGFTVGEETELRDYASNRDFIESLRRGEVPPELASRVRGGMVDVKLENKAFQDYDPKQQKTAAFTGEGFRLGAPAPAVVSEQQSTSGSSSETTSAKPSLDEIRQARLARFAPKPKPKEG